MIGQGIGQVLPQAIGVALSPAPIILLIVVMFGRRAMVNAGAFLMGWAVGLKGLSSASRLPRRMWAEQR